MVVFVLKEKKKKRRYDFVPLQYKFVPNFILRILAFSTNKPIGPSIEFISMNVTIALCKRNNHATIYRFRSTLFSFPPSPPTSLTHTHTHPSNNFPHYPFKALPNQPTNRSQTSLSLLLSQTRSHTYLHAHITERLIGRSHHHHRALNIRRFRHPNEHTHTHMYI